MPMNEWERLHRIAKSNKVRYPKGTKVVLEHMNGETSMPQGLEGTVQFVDDIGQIHVKWKNGRTLALNTEEDQFRIKERPLKEKGEPSR